MEVKTKLNIKLNDLKKTSFMCLILNTKGTKNSFNGKILGLTLSEWVKFACKDMFVSIVDYDKTENVLEFVKKHIDFAFDYTLILFSSTPLVTNQTIEKIKEYSQVKNVNLCKLHKGYVVNNKYLSSNQNLQVDSIYSGNLEEFYVVENKSEYTYAFKVLSDRINSFHINNGVEIDNPNNTYIEPFVDIDSGVRIMPNNNLIGKTCIAKNSTLKSGNTIENSKVGSDSCLSHSVITDSIIGQNVFVGSFSEIKNSLIGKNTTIENNCIISNYSIDVDSVIKANSNLGENNDSNSRIR